MNRGWARSGRYQAQTGPSPQYGWRPGLSRHLSKDSSLTRKRKPDSPPKSGRRPGEQSSPSLMDFVHQVLWYKLKTAERLSPWTKCSKCLVCGALETLHHSLNSCGFHVLIFDSFEKCWAPVTQRSVQYNVRCIPSTLSFSTPLGIMVWVARAAH